MEIRVLKIGLRSRSEFFNISKVRMLPEINVFENYISFSLFSTITLLEQLYLLICPKNSIHNELSVLENYEIRKQSGAALCQAQFNLQ